MAAGLQGQRFRFAGYLPVAGPDRQAALRDLEARSAAADETQVFIETPYRNQAMLETLMTACQPDTLLTIACDLTLDSEFLATRKIAEWTGKLPDIQKRPTVFLLYRAD